MELQIITLAQQRRTLWTEFQSRRLFFTRETTHSSASCRRRGKRLLRTRTLGLSKLRMAVIVRLSANAMAITMTAILQSEQWWSFCNGSADPFFDVAEPQAPPDPSTTLRAGSRGRLPHKVNSKAYGDSVKNILYNRGDGAGTNFSRDVSVRGGLAAGRAGFAATSFKLR